MLKILFVSFLMLSQNSPKIVDRHPVELSGCSVEDDPFGCHAEELTIENPLRRKVLVRINCGSDLDETELTLFPHTRQKFVIQTDFPSLSCRIGSWVSVEGKKD